MGFTLSTNIKNSPTKDFQYIVTANARRVLGSLIADYSSGIHSFTMIGTYGTGKSSFIMALERDLLFSTDVLCKNSGQFNHYTKFRCINIVGDYTTLSNLLCEELNVDKGIGTKEIFSRLDSTIEACKKKKEFVLIVVDEFGKVLEHATNNNPEKELYFLQQFAEYINRPNHDNVLFLSTLHQNFGAYARKLTEQQFNEWIKVKGRFKELVFSEPVEQLLHLAAEHISNIKQTVQSKGAFDRLFALAKSTKFIGIDFPEEVAKKLYPLDMFAAVALTQAIQRYGQNERSLFSFLMSQGDNSIQNFKATATKTYSLANVYDYIVYNFNSYLSEVNADSANWTAMRVALERTESVFDIEEINDACKLVKAIGLCNLFGASVKIIHSSLCQYASIAMDISNPQPLIDKLEALKIIRYAKYKSQYVLFDGTDINIEDELQKATGQIPKPVDILDDLNACFDFRVISANASYYKTGTPRFFAFHISNEAQQLPLPEDLDGYINLVFPASPIEYKPQLVEISKQCNNAVIYVLYKNVGDIVNHVYEIQKLNYVRTQVLVDDSDKVAIREVNNLIAFEKELLNNAINQSLTSFSENIEWYYAGKPVKISSLTDFNKLLSRVCDNVYFSTPIIKNELFNRQKINSAISLARVNLLNALIDDNRVSKDDLDFSADNFPPEKTIYYTLLKQTGIHVFTNGIYTLQAPKSEAIMALWNVCEDFLNSSTEKQRKIGELIKILKEAPFKLKQGFLDFWIPIYLIIKRQDYSLYNGDGVYIPNINREVLDLLQKAPDNFKVKTFAVDGIKLEFFNQYRNFINLNDRELITKDSFIETIKPFLIFYRNLNDYAKTTTKFDKPHTAKFREVLAKAKDPEKTFFEDLPITLGFKNESLAHNEEFMSQYQNLIKDAIRELRSCYHNLIERIEENVIETLGLQSTSFNEYKSEIDKRFKSIKPYLLSTKQRNFLNRVSFPITDKTAWYESICFVVLDKPLASLKDSEEALLMDSLRYLFNALTKFISISTVAKGNKQDEVYNVELVSTQGSFKPQSFVLPKSQKEKTTDLEQKIEKLLSGNDNLDICTLLRILNKKIGK
ncbi:MAG: hypothetical protein H6544_03910 [Prevotellaceae bacterium]|nr:hypothetical protein [Prevotellaceae bacterium]